MSAARDRTIASQDDGIDRELVVRPGAGLITSCMPPSQRSIERPTVERQEDGLRRAENALPACFTDLQRGQETGEYGEQHGGDRDRDVIAPPACERHTAYHRHDDARQHIGRAEPEKRLTNVAGEQRARHGGNASARDIDSDADGSRSRTSDGGRDRIRASRHQATAPR
jgi:hypothetical protein